MKMECKGCSSKDIREDEARAEMICDSCGMVCEVNDIQCDTEFHEMENGKVVAVGNIISNSNHANKLITINKAQGKIENLCCNLYLPKSIAAYALKIFKTALGCGITRGRNANVTAGACIYLAARFHNKPLMMLDVSDKIKVNVYELGKAYKKLQERTGQKVNDIDPVLFIDRFASKLEFGDKLRLVTDTALRLLQRMKKDWLSTGRKPSTLTAGALLIAARIHHFDRHYEDVAKIAGVSEQTIRKRLQEWTETSTANLTFSEFQTIDYEAEFDPPSFTDQQCKPESNGLEISDEDFSKIQNEIIKMANKLQDGENQVEESKSHNYLKQLVKSVEEDSVDIVELLGDIDDVDDSEADIDIEKNERKIMLKACIDSQAFRDTFNDFSKDEIDYKETESVLPLFISDMKQNETKCAPVENGELDMTDINDDELLEHYVLSTEETVAKLRWFYMENRSYYRNKKQTESRRRALQEKEENSGKKPRPKPQKRFVPDQATVDRLLEDDSNQEPQIKTPRLSPVNSDVEHEDESNSLCKDEVRDTVESDNQSEYGEVSYEYNDFM